LACFKGAREVVIYTAGGVTGGEERKQLVCYRVWSWLQNRMITELMWYRMHSWLQIKNITLFAKN